MGKVEEFEKMKLGMFVHFGLYSIVGKGEWYMHNEKVSNSEYDKLVKKFKVKSNWAKEIVKVAKSFGAKYIVLTTRHHDGFSLYDTKGLTEYDVINSPTKRDLVKEFVDECNKNKIKPFFYHTIIDWHDERFNHNPEAYFDFLRKSIELLCNNYGEVGGFWFDGTWSDDNFDWHLDEIFKLVKELQPQAIISNNGGWEHPGQIIHPDIDCIIYERVSSEKTTQKFDKKHRAKEVCQTLNNHWGFTKSDNNYKSAEQLKRLFDECQENGTNFLLNVGPLRNGKIRGFDKKLLKHFGKLITSNL